jgi:hypothetical protein
MSGRSRNPFQVAVRKLVTPAVAEEIVQVMVASALRGSPRAAGLIFSLLPKPSFAPAARRQADHVGAGRC